MPGNASDGSPLKLFRRNGVWRVECTELVPVDQHVLRPERRQVAAGKDVVRYLSRHCPPDRALEAAELMQEPDDGSEPAFLLEADGWRPVFAVVPSQRPIARRDIDTLTAEFKQQFMLMRSLYEALLARVIALETAAARPRSSVRPAAPSVARVPTRRDVLEALSSTQVAHAHPPVSAHAAVASEAETWASPAHAEPAPPAAHAASPAAAHAAPTAVVPAAPAEAPRLVVPSGKEVIEVLNMLGVDEATSGGPSVPPDIASTYFTPLATEAGEEVGAVVVDRRGAVELGGGLLGLPIPTRDEQATGEIATNTLDALNEIANNLVGIINRGNPKCYVRLRPLAAAGTDDLPWLAQAKSAVCVTTRASGAIWIFGR